MLDTFVNNFGEWMGAIALLVVGAERLVKLTPTKTDDRILSWARKIFRVLAVDVPDRQKESE